MKTITISKNDLRELVTESVRDVFDEELMKLRIMALPSVGPREQREIEKSLRQADRAVGKRIRVEICS